MTNMPTVPEGVTISRDVQPCLAHCDAYRLSRTLPNGHVEVLDVIVGGGDSQQRVDDGVVWLLSGCR